MPRAGAVIGMASDPRVRPREKSATVAKPMQLVMSRALWNAARQINLELRELAPFILTATVADDQRYTVAFEGDAVSPCPIRALLKPHPDGGYVLFTVNLDAAVFRVRFDFDRRLLNVTPLFENRGDVSPRTPTRDSPTSTNRSTSTCIASRLRRPPKTMAGEAARRSQPLASSCCGKAQSTVGTEPDPPESRTNARVSDGGTTSVSSARGGCRPRAFPQQELLSRPRNGFHNWAAARDDRNGPVVPWGPIRDKKTRLPLHKELPGHNTSLG